MTTFRAVVCCWIALTLPVQAPAQDKHSHVPGDSSSSLGTIQWVTSAKPEANRLFVRGVLLMHNFAYGEAISSFRAAQVADPGDVMSYWGEAMSHTSHVWSEQDTASGRAALRKLGATRPERLAKARTDRERAWLDAVETLYEGNLSKAHRDTLYAAAMERLHKRYPDDVEAAAFYSLALLGLSQGRRDTLTYARAFAIANAVLTKNPNHPGAAHYVIHAVDDPEHAHLGLRAARLYSQSAAASGHALHMTSHIFMALGMWPDVVRANEAAQATMPVLVGHAVEWLAYGLIQQGRYQAARRWHHAIAAEARRNGADDGGSWIAAAGITAAWNATTGNWTDAAATFRPQAKWLNHSGAMGIALGALGRGDKALADSMLKQMVEWNQADSTAPGEHWHGYPQVVELTLRALIQRAAGANDSALVLLRAAAAIDDTLAFEFGPPVEIKLPREAAGELLLEMQRPEEAAREFLAAAKRAPQRTAILLGLARAAWAQGQRTEAARWYGQLITIWKNADTDFRELREARDRARRSEEKE